MPVAIIITERFNRSACNCIESGLCNEFSWNRRYLGRMGTARLPPNLYVCIKSVERLREATCVHIQNIHIDLMCLVYGVYI